MMARENFRVSRRWVLASVLAGMATALPHPAKAKGQREPSGVAGNHYESSTWGFSLQWDPEVWRVVAGSELLDDELPYEGTSRNDGLTLTNGDSFLSIAGFEDRRIPTGDVLACRERQTALLQRRLDVSGVLPSLDANGFPMTGENEGSAYGLYIVTINKPTGVPTPFSVFIECRPLGPAYAFLVALFEAVPEEFDAQVPQVFLVLDSIRLAAGS